MLKNLSKPAKDLIKRWKLSQYDKSVYDNRPDWDTYFLNIAYEVAKRSPDGQTKHGSVLVSQTNEIIATGYNGTIRNIEDNILPNLRNSKYPFFIHSEINLLLSCARQGKPTLNTKIYITGEPCLHCYQCLWQAGIVEIIYGDTQSHMLQDKDTKIQMEILQELTEDKLKIRAIKTKKCV